MNNAEKQYLSDLEFRLRKLEAVVENIFRGVQEGFNLQLSCNQCGTYNPSQGYVCSYVDCCQGRNPQDDVEGDE